MTFSKSAQLGKRKKRRRANRLPPAAFTALCKRLEVERGPMCEECRKRPSVNAHHILFLSRGGGDTEENLILLCGVCHNAAHGITAN